MLLLVDLNFSPCYPFFEFLQVVMTKVRVYPRIPESLSPVS